MAENFELIQNAVGRLDRRGGDGAPLNILRTVSEALLDGNTHAARLAAQNAAVGAVTPSSQEIDPENADLTTGRERLSGRIGGGGQGGDVQPRGIRGLYKTRMPRQQGRERPTGLVDRADE